MTYIIIERIFMIYGYILYNDLYNKNFFFSNVMFYLILKL